jgi:hypothetical protein
MASRHCRSNVLESDMEHLFGYFQHLPFSVFFPNECQLASSPVRCFESRQKILVSTISRFFLLSVG